MTRLAGTLILTKGPARSRWGLHAVRSKCDALDVMQDREELLEKDAEVAALATRLREAGDPTTALLGKLADYRRREARSQ
jgi:hypothetical protein